MVRTAFDGRDIIKGLTSYEYRIAGHERTHVKLRLDRDDRDEPRIVTVPLKSRAEISANTFRSIAEQCGADDFHEWCRWIDRNR